MKNVTDLGDSHNGKSTRLINENGKEYIEKPRDALTEKVWASFLCALEAMGAEYLAKPVNILSESENSHTEEVVKHLSTDSEGIRRYYRRIGALLFLTYLLSSTDLHAENIIANGEYPVVVDVETLLSSNIARNNSKQKIRSTTFASGLLPHYIGQDDVCGICGKINDSKNLPMSDGKEVSVCDYVDDILKGFSDTYDIVLSHKDDIALCIEDFSLCKFREIPRNTRVYDYVIKKLIGSDDKRKTAYDLLSIAYIKDPDKNRINEAKLMLEAEIESVVNGNIPLFYVMGGECDLYSNGEAVMKNFYDCSPVEYTKRKLFSLSREDKEKEMKLISLSFESKKALPAGSVSEKDIVDQMINEFDRCFVPDFDSSFIYLTCENGVHSSYKSVDFGLYSGLSGILCAYSAAYAKTSRIELRSEIEKFLDKIEKEYDSSHKRNVTFLDKRKYELNDNSCSLSKGIAGTLLGLLHCHELTGNKRAYEIALKIAKSIDVTKIDVKKRDVLSGIGGMCLALPKLPAEIAFPIANALSSYLVCDDCALTGVAHGGAGRALALAATQKVLGNNSFDDEILRLLQFEDSYYDVEENNWLDLRVTDKKSFMRGWCSGAPGIGMARKKLLTYSDNKEIVKICEEDIERARKFLSENGTEYKRATLCCGEASFVMACSYLNVETNKCSNLINCIYADSSKLFHVVGTADLNPTLMQGFAGVAYAVIMQGDQRSGEMLL